MSLPTEHSAQKLLILTCKDDPHADSVIQKAMALGCGEYIIRLHPEDALSNLVVTYADGEMNILVKDSGRRFSTNEIGAVWFRKPEDIVVPNEVPDEARLFVLGQMTTVMQGINFLTSHRTLWINPRNSSQYARNKIKQLAVAKALGFDIPDTVVTNDVGIARSFFEKHPVFCTKDLDTAHHVMFHEKHPMYTLKVSSDDGLAKIDSVANTPTLLQEFIEKDLDIRVTVVGNMIHAVAIHSQDRVESSDDFRIVSPVLLRHTKHELPEEVSRRVISFMQYYGLAFSAFDFALTKEGKYFFLENNPNGQWLWLEELAGVPISDSFIDLFTKQLSW